MSQAFNLKNEIEKYTAQVTANIMSFRIKKQVKQEYADHIEDSVYRYMLLGFSEKEAFIKACEDMGDINKVKFLLSEIHNNKCQIFITNKMKKLRNCFTSKQFYKAVIITFIIIVAATISVVVLRRSAAPPLFGGGSGGGGYVGPQTQGVVPATPSAEPVVSKKEKVEGKIEKFLQDNGIANDVSVAVYNNLTQEQYSSSNGNRIYTAWGLYLPVYLAYGKNSNIDWGAYESIMSSDPGVCNENANYAIRSMGGFQAVNDRLKNYYGATGTTYGRFFGDTGASTDNYTTANDSVRFLSELDKMDKHGLLSYNLGSFGISAPGGASVNAHIGTENRSERNRRFQPGSSRPCGS